MSLSPTRHGLILTKMALFLAIAVPCPGVAQKLPDGVLVLDGQILPDGSEVRLSWTEAKPPRTGNTAVSRRRLGESGAPTWQDIAPRLGAAVGYADKTTQPGIAYEYRVQRTDLRSGEVVDTGYWATGVDVPRSRPTGVAFLVVDETIAQPLSRRIARLEMDLVGDGWTVERIMTPRSRDDDPVATLALAREIKARIADRYWADPFGQHAIILLGRVPLVLSGQVAPDGHSVVSVGTDLFYADIDGTWPDNGAGVLTPSAIPDGRIEMPVGRIDFTPVNPPNSAGEIDDLRAYLDKNHAWRHGLHGDLRNAYGRTLHLLVEVANLDNIVGPGAVTKGGHHDVGEEHPWLIGVDFGSARGRDYAEKYANKAIFALNFGSGKHRIERPRNAMVALLAQPWYPVAVGWGARPAWRLHAMAMGRGFGDAQMRTVNNGLPWQPYPASMDYVPTGLFLFRNPVWGNLVGDPTLEPFPARSPRGLRADRDSDGIRLRWAASEDTGFTAYHVYRADDRMGPYTLLGDVADRDVTEFADADGTGDHWYMLRIEVLKSVYAGSFHRFSQGAFATAGGAPVEAPDGVATAVPGIGLAVLPPPGLPPASGGWMISPVSGVPEASLARTGEIWTLTPDETATGPFFLRYMVGDGLTVDDGVIEIDIERN